MSLSIKNKVRKRALKMYNDVKPIIGTKKEFLKNFEIIYSIAMGDASSKSYHPNDAKSVTEIVQKYMKANSLTHLTNPHYPCICSLNQVNECGEYCGSCIAFKKPKKEDQ